MKITDTTISPPPEVSCAASAAVGPPTQTGGGPLLPAYFIPALKLPKKALDLTGKQFNKLQVLGFIGQNKYKTAYWLCRCICGNVAFVLSNNLHSTHSCGCEAAAYRDSTRQKLIGKRFGRLIVTSCAGQVATGTQYQTVWTCECDCGARVIVRGNNLLTGHTKSCGCRQPSIASGFCGSRSPHWKPGLTQEDRDRYRLGTPTNATCQALARQVRRRDHATCLVCGKHGTHVHHLEPWALNRNLRYNPANLVTLCKECHDQFHYLYGKDAGLDEFEEYLKP